MDGVSQEQFEYAKQQILLGQCYVEFPPTAAQFRLLCKSKPEYFQPKPSPQAQPYKRTGSNVTGELEFWFKGLKEGQKTKVYEGALKAWPVLEDFLNISNESYLDSGFERSIWFTRMIEAFMGYYKISSLRGLI